MNVGNEFGGQPPLEIVPWETAGEPEVIAGSAWFNPTGSVKAAGEYEAAQREKGEPVDAATILELSGAKEVHLELIGLDNGLRYVLIRNDEGDDVFSSNEYAGLITCGCGAIHDMPAVTSASTIRDTDLGDGYALQTVSAARANSYRVDSYIGGQHIPETRSYPDHMTSHIEKQRQDTAGGNHTFRYQIDPHKRSFSSSYNYYDGETVEEIWLTEGVEPVRFAAMTSASGDQVDVMFGPDGAISSIIVSGRYMLGDEKSEPEFLAITEASRRGIRRLEGEEIDSSFARSVMMDVLGFTPAEETKLSEVRIDTKTLVEQMIANIDGQELSRPQSLLAAALR